MKKSDLKKSLSKIYKLSRKMKIGRGSSINTPVLCYHSISPKSIDSGFRVLPDNFEKQINYLTENFQILTLTDFVYRLAAGADLNSTAVVTFDDGYLDNYEFAFPILEKYSCPSTVFLPTSFIDGKVCLNEDNEKLIPMSWEQITEAFSKGLISFQSHGQLHQTLNTIPIEQARCDIIESKKLLEQRLGCTIDHFCYPNGGFNDNIKRIVAEAGYKSAFTTLSSTFHNSSDIYGITRILIDRYDDFEIFKEKLEGNYNYLKIIQMFKFKSGLI